MGYVSLFESEHGEATVLKTLPDTGKNIERLHVDRAKLFLEEGRLATLIRTEERPQEWGKVNRTERRKRDRILARLIKKLPKAGIARVDDPQAPPIDLILPGNEAFK
jgi:hypothetical protein